MQYLGENTLVEATDGLVVEINDLVSADSYDESKLLEKFKIYKPDEKIILLKCAIQISIIGSGNRNYGFVRHGDVIHDIKTLFKNLNIKHDNNLNSKYESDEFSSRRLTRFFRYQIKEFIIRTNRPSYLWLKYSDKNQKFISICFPGGEHLVETKEEAKKRAEKEGFDISSVVKAKTGDYYIAPKGIKSESAKKAYADIRAEGKDKESAAKNRLVN